MNFAARRAASMFETMLWFQGRYAPIAHYRVHAPMIKATNRSNRAAKTTTNVSCCTTRQL
jgi:hypothetical protein